MKRVSLLKINFGRSVTKKLALRENSIRQVLLRWFKQRGRKFIWREKNESYLVLVAELLLKKTTAPVVNRFLPIFLKKYPTLECLAKSRLSSVRSLLKPLGLSDQRGRQLIQIARTIKEKYDGIIPSKPKDLLSLPGIGEYTANSIRCVSFRCAAPIVDTNVGRIILRVFSIHPSRYEARRSPEIWGIAAKLAGKSSTTARIINWALLDIGAMNCLQKKPKCPECPLVQLCDQGMSFPQLYTSESEA